MLLPGAKVALISPLVVASITPPPIPAEQPPPTFSVAYTAGYVSAVEWRLVSGGGGG